jgi:hypothetical protein
MIPGGRVWITGNPEVISSLVLTNALVLSGLANFREVGNSEVILGHFRQKLDRY